MSYYTEGAWEGAPKEPREFRKAAASQTCPSVGSIGQRQFLNILKLT